ncbi:MAG: InlB B-repeat-containing protein [Opitutales bacterium]
MKSLLFSLSWKLVISVLVPAVVTTAGAQSIVDIQNALDNPTAAISDGDGFTLVEDDDRVDGDFLSVAGYDSEALKEGEDFSRYNLQIEVEGPAKVSFEYFLSDPFEAGTVGVLIQGDDPSATGGVVGFTDFEDRTDEGPDGEWAVREMEIPTGTFTIFVAVDLYFPVNGNSLDFRMDNLTIESRDNDLEPAAYFYATSSDSDPTVETYEEGTFTLTASGFLGDYSFQWYKDDIEIVGATGAELTVVDAVAGDGGDSGLYSFEFTNGTGSSRAGYEHALVVDPVAISALVNEALDTTGIEFTDGARFALEDDGEGGDYLSAPPFLATAENSFDLGFEVTGPAIVSFDYYASDADKTIDSDVTIDGVLKDGDGLIIQDFGYVSDSSNDLNNTDGWTTLSYRIPDGTYRFSWDVDIEEPEAGESPGEQRWDNLTIIPETESEDPLVYLYDAAALPHLYTIAAGTPFTFDVEILGDLSFQWFVDVTPDDGISNPVAVSGATSASLELSPADLSDSGFYSLAITDGDITQTIDVLDLSVESLPVDSVGNLEALATELGNPTYISPDPANQGSPSPETSKAIQYFGDYDYFGFSLSEDGLVDIYTEGNADTAGILYNSEGVIVKEAVGNGELANFSMSNLELGAGDYTLAVLGASEFKLGAYDLFIEPTRVALIEITESAMAGIIQEGGNFEFSVTAFSASPITYSWSFKANGESEFEPLDLITKSSWSLDGATGAMSGTYQVVLDNGFVAETLTGELVVTHAVSVRAVGSGSISVKDSNGASLSSVDLETIASGTEIILTAVPATGFYFSGWELEGFDGAVPFAESFSLIIVEGGEVVANFEPIPEIQILGSSIGGNILLGQDVSFNVSATSGVSIAYSWYFRAEDADDFELIELVNQPSWTLPNVSSEAAGTYEVVLDNGFVTEKISGKLAVEEIEIARDAFSSVSQVASFDDGETTVEWLYVDWFGLFEASQVPWVYHEPLGWILIEDDTKYSPEAGGESLWVWLSALEEWFLFSEFDDPFIWSDTDQEWQYRFEEDGEVWIYSYTEEAWELAN